MMDCIAYDSDKPIAEPAAAVSNAVRTVDWARTRPGGGSPLFDWIGPMDCSRSACSDPDIRDGAVSAFFLTSSIVPRSRSAYSNGDRRSGAGLHVGPRKVSAPHVGAVEGGRSHVGTAGKGGPHAERPLVKNTYFAGAVEISYWPVTCDSVGSSIMDAAHSPDAHAKVFWNF